MSTYKIQRVRDCISCGNGLPLKCGACAKHPERKPRIVEWHNWPPILKVAECGCCAQFACQNPKCSEKVWRSKKQSSTGLSRSATLFCSKRCNVVTQNATRDTRVPVQCGWNPCGRTVLRRASMVKTFKAAYCRPSHYQWAMAKKRHDAKEAVRAALDGTDGRALLQCFGKCRDVTEHATRGHGATCGTCGAVRSADFVFTGAR